MIQTFRFSQMTQINQLYLSLAEDLRQALIYYYTSQMEEILLDFLTELDINGTKALFARKQLRFLHEKQRKNQLLWVLRDMIGGLVSDVKKLLSSYSKPELQPWSDQENHSALSIFRSRAALKMADTQNKPESGVSQKVGINELENSELFVLHSVTMNTDMTESESLPVVCKRVKPTLVLNFSSDRSVAYKQKDSGADTKVHFFAFQLIFFK